MDVLHKSKIIGILFVQRIKDYDRKAIMKENKKLEV